MVQQLSWPRLAGVVLLCSWAFSPAAADLTEKHYRQAAWQFYLEQPVAALEALQIAPSSDARTQLLEAGLYLQLDMPLQAATLLQQVLAQPADSQHGLPQALRNVALLQFSRYQLEMGNKVAAKYYLAQVQLTADKQYLGQQQLLSQLLAWPDIYLPKAPEFNYLASQAEMPYIISNQALIIAKQQPDIAHSWLAQLQARLAQADQQSFWQQLFSGHWLLLNPPVGFSYPQAEQQALVDYVQLTRAELYISQQNWAAADEILNSFPQNSILITKALQLYQQILTEQRHIPTLLAVLQQQIKLQPYSVTAWHAATSIGEQLERNLQPAAALTAYRWADDYYQQQQYSLLNETKPLNANQLEQPLTPWLQLQFSNDEQLHQLQQQSLMLQQLLNQAPQRQARLVRLQQVADYKLAKQQSLLHSQLPLLTQQQQSLTDQLVLIKNQISEQNQQPKSAFLSQGKLQQQLISVQQAKKRLTQLQQQDSHSYQAQAQRLQRLEGLVHWQYQDDKVDRLWQLSKLQQQLEQELKQLQAKLQRLATLGSTEARLNQQQQRLQHLSATQQQLNMALLSKQQQLLAQLNQHLHQHRQLQSQQLQQLQRHNKQAMARMMELLLSPANSSLHGAKDAD